MGCIGLLIKYDTVIYFSVECSVEVFTSCTPPFLPFLFLLIITLSLRLFLLTFEMISFKLTKYTGGLK